MKGKLAFLLGMALGQCFVWGINELLPLKDACVWGRDFPGLWKDACKKIQKFVPTTLSDTEYKFDNSDLVALWTFLEHGKDFKAFLENFVGTDEVSEVDYESLGKHLFLLAHKAVNSIDSNFVDQNYCELVRSKERILDLFKKNYFESTNKRMKEFLESYLDFQD